MCRSMVDIHSATAEIRRGKKKKEERRRNHRTKIHTVMSASAMQGGHNKFTKKTKPKPKPTLTCTYELLMGARTVAHNTAQNNSDNFSSYTLTQENGILLKF